jgi:hypothetical protein
MKQRILPFGFLSLLIFGLAVFFLSFATSDNKDQDRTAESVKNEGAIDYLASIRNNQHTGVLNPADVIKAREQAAQQNALKSGQGKAYTWDNLGPDNMGGRTRALIFDNRDASNNTIYAGSATGGIFKSTNLGANWSKTNLTGVTGLNVTSMVQHSNGTIYAATGEGFNSQDFTGTGQYGYEGGFLGKGIFKSDNNDKFSLIQSTKPVIGEEVVEWGYINEIALDENEGRLFAATNTGLKVANLSDLSTWQSEFKHMVDSIIYERALTIDSVVTCDSFAIVDGELKAYGSLGWQIDVSGNDTVAENIVYREYVPFDEYTNCYDVKVSENGWVIATFGEKIYVSSSGNINEFVCKSIYPENEESVRWDNISWTTHFLIKDKQGNVLLDSTATSVEVYDWHTDYYYDDGHPFQNYPTSEEGARTEFAIAPSDQNVVYAQVAKGSSPARNSLQGIYLSEDGGESWRVIAPGGSTLLNILGSTPPTGTTPYYIGDYANTISVFPNDPYRILAGGVDLWIGRKVNENGYYSWDRKSVSVAANLQNGIFDEFYCHKNHHAYIFRPESGNQFIAGTSGGMFLGKVVSNAVTFQSINKNYVSSQFYTLDISSRPNEYVGGTQDNGPLYNRGKGGTGQGAEDMWRPQNFEARYPIGTDGGSVAFSTIRSITPAGDEVAPPVYYSIGPFPSTGTLNDRTRRSETLGYDYSANDVASDMTDTRFITPMILWESYNDNFSQIMIDWIAYQDYQAGDSIVVRSNTMGQPFYHVLSEDLSTGDTLQVQDVITTKMFVGIEDEVYMTIEGIDFAANPEWFLISDRLHNGVDGVVQCLAYSSDGNYLWVGTAEGKLYRVSGIAYAYDYDKADVNSSNCVIATTEVPLGEENTQIVTSISVDPKDPDKVLVTLGNYGNTQYVYYCVNGTSDAPDFASAQGNLPAVPVYASLLEFDDESDAAMLGTELGLYATDDIGTGEWYYASEEMGEVPVMAIKQQTLWKGTFTIKFLDPGTGQAFYEIYPGIENYQDIYVATYGRGVFKYDVDAVGIDENPVENGMAKIQFEIFPNPASDNISIQVLLAESSDLQISVYDLSGKLVILQQIGRTPVGNHEIPVNVSDLQKGTYLMKVIAGDKVGTSKLVVIK